MRQRRGTLLEAVVGDGRGTLKLTFFNQAWRERDLVVGRRGLFAGKVTVFNRTRQLNGPEYKILGVADDEEVEEFAGGADPGLPGLGRGADLGDRPVRRSSCWRSWSRCRTRCRRRCGRGTG